MKKWWFSLVMSFLLPAGNGLMAQIPDTIRLYNWTLDESYLGRTRVPVDTLTERFQVIHPAFRNPAFMETNGNIGAPIRDMSFINRESSQDFLFLGPYLPYLNTPLNTRFFNTKRPFTHLQYTTAGTKSKQEQTLQVLHTQNIDSLFNAGMQYNLISSEGQYSRQKTRLPLFRFFSSFERKHYTAHASFNSNLMDIEENGGIAEDADLGTARPEDLAVNLPENLNDAGSFLRHINLAVVQTYTLGKPLRETARPDTALTKNRKLQLSGTFSHLLEYERSSRTYTDQEPGSGFYDTSYINTSLTYDSAYSRTLRNTLQFEFLTDPSRKVSLLVRTGISHEFQHFANIMPTDTVIRVNEVEGVPVNDTTYVNLLENDYQNLRAGFTLRNSLTRAFEWEAGGQLYLSGYKQGDFRLQGNIILRPGKDNKRWSLLLSGELENRKPQYFLENYRSNHFRWSPSFGNTTFTRVGGLITEPENRFSLRGDYALIDNHVYFDSTALPRQETAPISLISADAGLRFGFGLFRTSHRLLMQISSNELAAPVPLLSYYQSAWLDYRIFFRFTNGTLYYQLGFDFWYHTPYYGPGYMPATGMFYNQHEKKTAGYPYLDVFLNLKLKRTRFFLKFEHVYSGWLSPQYFTVLHYPMNERMFKFGLAWTFYD